MRRRRRTGFWVVVLLVAALLGAGVWAFGRVSASPDLGAAPQGPAHADSELGLAAWAARSVAPELVRGGHGSVTLSEADLTLELRAHGAAVHGLRDTHARLRDGLVVVDGLTDLGPLNVTAVGRLRVGLVRDPDGLPDIGVDFIEIDAGTLPLPGPVRDAVERRILASVDLGRLLAASPLAPVRAGLECLAVGGQGLRLGFHAPGVLADPARCGR